MNSSNPQYFELQRVENEENVTIVGTDVKLSQDMIDTNKNFEIRCDNLTFEENIHNNGNNILINARIITSEKNSDITIDVTGPSPLKDYVKGDRAKAGFNGGNGTDGNSASNGNNGGQISVNVLFLKCNLKLISDGGVGGRGQDGGNGGDGVNGSNGSDAKIRHGLNDSIKHHATEGSPGQNGGKGGDGGLSGHGGNGGSIQDSVVIKDIDISVEYSNKMGEHGEKSIVGNGGNFGNGGVGGRKAKCHSQVVPGTRDVITDCYLIDSRANSGQNGVIGLNGKEAPLAVDGKIGNVNSYRGNDAMLSLMTTASVPQRKLIRHMAKLDYLNANYDDSKSKFDWLLKITPSLSQFNPVQSRANIYAVSPTEWDDFYNSVVAINAQLQQGLNFYGYPVNYVPLLSLDYYQKQLDVMLILGQQIEGVFNRYDDIKQNQEEQIESVQESFKLSKNNLSELKKVSDDLIEKKKKSEADIDRMFTELKEKEKEILELSDKFKDAVCDYFKLSFTDVMSMMWTMILVGVDVYNTYSNIQSLTKELGTKEVEFKNVIEKIELVSDGVNGIQDKFKAIETYNTKTTPDSGKLVMEKDKFDEMMDEFVNTFTEAEEYKAAMDSYIDLIQARNNAIVNYNSLFIKAMVIDNEMTEKSNELKIIQAAWSKLSDPTTSEIRMYMLDLYMGTKKRLLDYLFQENSAYNYWALENRKLTCADNTIAELSNEHIKLKGDIMQYMNTVSAPAQNFTDIRVEYTMEKNKSEIEKLIRDNVTTISINSNDTNFLGLSNVLVTNIKVILVGAKVKSDKLYVSICHNGNPELIDKNGAKFRFNHESILSVYKYNQLNNETIVNGTLGGSDTNYIGVSPFASWTLYVPKGFNPELDLS